MGLRTKSVVMLRMNPPRHSRGDSPDVALLFGEDRYREVAALTPGDWVNFEATMQAHGYRGDPEVMTMWHIAAVKRPSLLGNKDALVAKKPSAKNTAPAQQLVGEAMVSKDNSTGEEKSP